VNDGDRQHALVGRYRGLSGKDYDACRYTAALWQSGDIVAKIQAVPPPGTPLGRSSVT
jgi:hypothetical protein